MLPLSQLREIPDELANRMMVAHGSRMLLRALQGEPEPPVALPPLIIRRPRQPKRRHPYIAVRARPEAALPTPVRAIMQAVADSFEITLEDLRGPGRGKCLVYARAVAFRLIRNREYPHGEPRYSLPRIGSFFGRDHSTVCHAMDHFDDYCRHQPEVAAVYESLREMAA